MGKWTLTQLLLLSGFLPPHQTKADVLSVVFTLLYKRGEGKREEGRGFKKREKYCPPLPIAEIATGCLLNVCCVYDKLKLQASSVLSSLQWLLPFSLSAKQRSIMTHVYNESGPSNVIRKLVKVKGQSHFYEPTHLWKWGSKPQKASQSVQLAQKGARPSSSGQLSTKKSKGKYAEKQPQRWANITQVEQVHPHTPGAGAKARHTQAFPPGLVWSQVNRKLVAMGLVRAMFNANQHMLDYPTGKIKK